MSDGINDGWPFSPHPRKTATMIDPAREQLIEALAKIYLYSSAACVAVANVCDTSLDKSGRLLGEVRNKVAALRAYDKEHPNA